MGNGRPPPCGGGRPFPWWEEYGLYRRSVQKVGDEQADTRHIGDQEQHGDEQQDDGADGRRSGRDGGGVGAVEASLIHGADQHAADGGDVGRGGAGHAGEQHRGQDVDMGQAAGDEPDQLVDKPDDALGHAAGVHDLAGKDEQRDGHQREGIAAGDSMEDVDHAVGFGNYSTIYCAFKNEYGISPKQYRQM